MFKAINKDYDMEIITYLFYAFYVFSEGNNFQDIF